MSENKPPSFVVREWEKEDCEAVMKMVMELAVYEKLEDQVNINVESLRKEGFGTNPFLKGLVVEDSISNGEASINGRKPLIGYILYFYKFSTFEGSCIYIEDIYVPERLRGRGIGKALFKALAQIAAKNEYESIELSVLSWNKSSIGFYEKLGAVNLTDKDQWSTVKEQWSVFRLHKNEIVKLATSN